MTVSQSLLLSDMEELKKIYLTRDMQNSVQAYAKKEDAYKVLEKYKKNTVIYQAYDSKNKSRFLGYVICITVD